MMSGSRLLTAMLLSTVCLASAPASAAVVFESIPSRQDGFPDQREEGSTAVGRMVVSATTTINGFGVLNYLVAVSNLKFFIADANSGAMLYLSTAKSFDADTGGVSNASLTYKDSDALSFTFNPGTAYAVGSIADGTTYTYADSTHTNTSGPFTSLLGNVNVADYANPVLDTGQACCSIGFRLTQSDVAAVPEPATWAMMLVGFGFVGAGMRRKQRRTVRLNFA